MVGYSICFQSKIQSTGLVYQEIYALLLWDDPVRYPILISINGIKNQMAEQ
jgi:hypothetical protein